MSLTETEELLNAILELQKKIEEMEPKERPFVICVGNAAFFNIK